MTRTRTTRRTFLGGLTAAAVGVPTLLRAQPRTVKIGMVCPVSGPMADVGQDSRLGAQLAVEAINAAGGVMSLGGARLELLTADSETKADVARTEADRLINAGAQIMTGAYHSAHVATISLLAQQRRVPVRHRHLGRGRAHRQRGQVGAGGPAEDPVRLPDLPGQRHLRPQRGPLHDRDLPRGEGEPEAARAHVQQRPLRQDPDRQLPGRDQGGESRLRGGRRHPLPRERGRSLHRGRAGPRGQAGRAGPGHPSRHRDPAAGGAGAAADRADGRDQPRRARALRDPADPAAQGQGSST